MTRAEFDTVILDGHKDSAIEVPFDPPQKWAIPAGPLWPGRRGHFGRGTLNGVTFESAAMPRARRFYVVVGAELQAAAGVAAGDAVHVSLEPGSRSAAVARSRRAHVVKE